MCKKYQISIYAKINSKTLSQPSGVNDDDITVTVGIFDKKLKEMKT